MSKQDLTQSVQELMAQMKAELNSLKAASKVLPQAKPAVSTTRR